MGSTNWPRGTARGADATTRVAREPVAGCPVGEVTTTSSWERRLLGVPGR